MTSPAEAVVNELFDREKNQVNEAREERIAAAAAMLSDVIAGTLEADATVVAFAAAAGQGQEQYEDILEGLRDTERKISRSSLAFGVFNHESHRIRAFGYLNEKNPLEYSVSRHDDRGLTVAAKLHFQNGGQWLNDWRRHSSYLPRFHESLITATVYQGEGRVFPGNVRPKYTTTGLVHTLNHINSQVDSKACEEDRKEVISFADMLMRDGRNGPGL